MLKKGEKPYAGDAASKLVAALVERLRVALDESTQAENKVQAARAASLQESIDGVKKRLAEVGESLKSVRDLIGQAGDSAGDPSYQINNLRTQKRNSENELTRQKSDLAAMMPEGGSDAVTAWEAAVKSQEERLTMLQNMQPKGPTDAKEIADQKARLAETQAQLANRPAAGGIRPIQQRRHVQCLKHSRPQDTRD